jgi:dolichyl-phosphate-mannose--protein O-mannosyl transferase
MSQAPEHPRDPLAWNVAVALIFLALLAIRLTVPSKAYFDEVHYVPAARVLMELARPTNVEHPLLGKELIALGMRLFGDNPLGWRIMPVLFGTLGLAMAAKWNAAPLAMLPGIAFVVVRFRAMGWRALTGSRAAPVAGITIWEAALWLGLVPLVVYALTFVPAMFYAQDPLSPGGLIALHQKMIHLQEEVVKPHPYQSVWYQWVFDWRAIWFLYEKVDGAQRGVLLVGNPLTMLLGLIALVWAGVHGFTEGRRDALALFVLYAVSLGLWVVADKPVQFYYHYLLPGTFLMGMLALALDSLWRRGCRALPLLALAGSVALFAYFYPILAAAPLESPQSFAHWMWLDSWR